MIGGKFYAFKEAMKLLAAISTFFMCRHQIIVIKLKSLKVNRLIVFLI